jgi:hypothetical protein
MRCVDLIDHGSNERTAARIEVDLRFDECLLALGSEAVKLTLLDQDNGTCEQPRVGGEQQLPGFSFDCGRFQRRPFRCGLEPPGEILFGRALIDKIRDIAARGQFGEADDVEFLDDIPERGANNLLVLLALEVVVTQYKDAPALEVLRELGPPLALPAMIACCGKAKSPEVFDILLPTGD